MKSVKEKKTKKKKIPDALDLVFGEEEIKIETPPEPTKDQASKEKKLTKPLKKKIEEKKSISVCFRLPIETVKLLDGIFVKRYKEREWGRVSKSEIIREAILLLAKKEGIK